MFVEAYGRKLSREYQQQKREEVTFLDFEGDVVMDKPDNTFYIFEDVGEHKPASFAPRRFYFVREV